MTHQQTVGFAWASAIVIVALVLLQVQGGTAGDVGFVIGLPVILVLLVLWIRGYRSRARAQTDPLERAESPGGSSGLTYGRSSSPSRVPASLHPAKSSKKGIGPLP